MWCVSIPQSRAVAILTRVPSLHHSTTCWSRCAATIRTRGIVPLLNVPEHIIIIAVLTDTVLLINENERFCGSCGPFLRACTHALFILYIVNKPVRCALCAVKVCTKNGCVYTTVPYYGCVSAHVTRAHPFEMLAYPTNKTKLRHS